MKFTVKKSDILDVLGKVQGITGRKSNLAITSSILIRVGESGIAITATDLETGFEGTYPVTVESPGEIAINARKFFEIVRKFPVDDIQITEVENHWIEITNKNIEYHLVGMKPEDFPSIPQFSTDNFFDVDSSALKNMIEKSLVIGPTDDKRAHIIGVFMEQVTVKDQPLLRLVSTDGSRLSKVEAPISNPPETPWESGILVPKKGLSEVNKFLDDDGTVEIGLKDNHFIVRKDKETIIIRLLEGEFPKYGDIIKKLGGNVVTVDKALFQQVLERMSILGSENYKGVIFDFSTEKLVVSSTNPDIGESKEEVAVEYGGANYQIAFNPRFFIDVINVIDKDAITLNIIDEDKPCLIDAEDDHGYLCVIMPMRI